MRFAPSIRPLALGLLLGPLALTAQPGSGAEGAPTEATGAMSSTSSAPTGTTPTGTTPTATPAAPAATVPEARQADKTATAPAAAPAAPPTTAPAAASAATPTTAPVGSASASTGASATTSAPAQEGGTKGGEGTNAASSSRTEAGATAAVPENGSPVAPQAREITRDTYNAQGKLIRSLTTRGTEVTREVVYSYDDKGRPVREETRAGQTLTVVERTFDGGGRVIEEKTAVDGKRTSVLTQTFEDAQLVSSTKLDATGVGTMTRYTYDLYGRVTKVEVVDTAGTLLTQRVADIPRPLVPISVGLDAGGNYQTDVDQLDLVTGFSIGRKPAVETFGADPLEVSVSGSYRFSRSKGIPTNNQLLAHFGVDYNNLLPQTTFFLFSNVERNPIANLNIDLTLAPIGIKYNFAKSEAVSFDLSFAPVWNYRSTQNVVEGQSNPDGSPIYDDVSTSYLRGSLRARGAVRLGPVGVSEVFEFLPNLLPEGLSFQQALDQQSILNSTTTIQIRLTNRISLKEELKFTRDMSLVAQATPGDTFSTLDEGYTFSALTTLGIKFEILR